MKSPIATVFFALVLTSLSAQAQRRHHEDDRDRVFFDNRTSSMLSIYKAPLSSRSRPVKNLESGDICALPSGANVQWVVSTPVWYRLVSSIKTTERGLNRLVIRDSDLRAIGGTAVNTSFTNRSGVPVKVKIVVDGVELDWMWISNGRSSKTLSFPRQKWVVREQSSGKLLQRETTGNGTTNIQINPQSSARGRDRDRDRDRHHDHGSERRYSHTTDPVELTLTNNTANAINIYRKTTFGSRKVGTIASRRSATIDTEAGEVWRIEDSVTLEVLETIVVPKDDPHCKVAISNKKRPSHSQRPSEPKQVTINFHNDTDDIVFIYKLKDGKFKYTKRIYPDREYPLEFAPGQSISIRNPKTGKELESLKAPSRSTTVHIKPHRDHRPAPKPATKPKPKEEPEENLRPRDILRRIIRGE